MSQCVLYVACISAFIRIINIIITRIITYNYCTTASSSFYTIHVHEKLIRANRMLVRVSLYILCKNIYIYICIYVYIIYVDICQYSLKTYNKMSPRKENVWTAEVARFDRIYTRDKYKIRRVE